MRNTYHIHDKGLDNEINDDRYYDVSMKSVVLRSIIIALGLSFVLSFLIIMLNFVRQNILINVQTQQIQSIIAIVLWVFLTIFILVNTSKQLAFICVSNFSFGSIYAFSTLPTIQLMIDVSQSLNNGNFPAVIFVLLTILINIVFVVVINVFLSKVCLSRKIVDLLMLSLLMYCALVVFIDMQF